MGFEESDVAAALAEAATGVYRNGGSKEQTEVYVQMEFYKTLGLLFGFDSGGVGY